MFTPVYYSYICVLFFRTNEIDNNVQQPTFIYLYQRKKNWICNCSI